MKALIELMAKSLVDRPEEVVVTGVEGEQPFLNCVLLMVTLGRLLESREIQREQ